MSEESNSGSIVSEVDERLDAIFGKDEGEVTLSERGAASPLDELRGLLLTIDKKINKDTITALNTAVKQLQSSYVSDKDVLPLLKIISLLVGSMKPEKADVHPDITKLLNSTFQCMETMAENKSISTHEKRALIGKEIDNLNKFRVKISSGGEPSAKKTLPRTGEIGAEGSEPAPTAEPSLANLPPREIFTAFDDLRSFLGEELAALKRRVEDLEEAFTSSDNLRAHLSEELAELKGRMDDLGGLSDKFGNVRTQLFEALTSVQGQVSNLEGAISRLQGDLLTARSQLEVIRGSVGQFQSPPPSDESGQGLEKSPEDPEAGEWHISEHDLIVEGASSDDKPQELQTDSETMSEDEQSKGWEQEAFDSHTEERNPEAKSVSSGHYFLFEMGGKRYAVDDGNVIKASKASRHLLRKASDKGELTMMDCRRMFSDMKRGIEPAWNHLSSKDLKKTTFHVLTDDRIDGLLDTNGGGMLFLGSGEKHSVLFTDQRPKKKRLSRRNNVKRLSVLPYVYGAIEKKGRSAEKYLLLDADQLCKRLRMCIPAPFTKI